MSADDSLADHKFCGFLCAVLTLTPSQRHDDGNNDHPRFSERCEIFSDGARVGFRTQNGVVLGPVVSAECESSRAKRTRKVGTVNGSISVVHQLHALVTRKCLKIDARVVCVEVPRVVVLVDVYLPIQLWSGWQFPRSGSVAGAVFRHLRCKEWCRLPLITPCRHLLCLDCVSIDKTKCTYPGCGNLYEMQSPDAMARPENPNPKWAVPKDLIELQPSYKQDNWDPDWQSTSSSKVAYLVKRLKALQGTNEEMGLYTDNSNDDMHTENSFPLHTRDAKSSFQEGSISSTKTNLVPEKVLIFSQFLEHIHVIEQQLAVNDIKYTGMYSPMHSSNKKKSLAMFQHDSSCMALLMDGSAALGLDLSFVTHVFLMEPIWDRSMEEQVISRAHRMGASRPIHVETLAMRGTIEEQMLRFLQDADKCRRFPSKNVAKSEDDSGGRGYRSLHDFAESSYLLELRFV